MQRNGWQGDDTAAFISHQVHHILCWTRLLWQSTHTHINKSGTGLCSIRCDSPHAQALQKVVSSGTRTHLQTEDLCTTYNCTSAKPSCNKEQASAIIILLIDASHHQACMCAMNAHTLLMNAHSGRCVLWTAHATHCMMNHVSSRCHSRLQRQSGQIDSAGASSLINLVPVVVMA
jgi:hypothetical protein